MDAAHGWARYGPVVPTVTSCLVRRAPVGVRGELGELGTVPDRLAALALDARDRQLVGSGESWASYLLGAVGGTDRWRALCAGQLQFEELGTLAALCRVRPELGQALGEELARAVTGPWDGEVRYRARAVAALAWTIPWSLPGGGRSRELGEGLEALAELADDRARAELGALTVLAGMGTVPGSIQAAARRVGDAYGVRPWRRGRDLRCYCRLAGAGGGRYARWLLVGRGRRRGPVAELLRVRPCTGWVGRDHGWSDVRAVERACGADTGAWRLALSLADGQLTGEELAATVSVALR